MSNQAAKKERHKNDFYETPAVLTQELLKRIEVFGNIIEPCCGENAIGKILYDHADCLVFSDINKPISDRPSDATTKEYWESWTDYFVEKNNHQINFTVTNPPFSKAHLILPLAFEYSTNGVAFLLRSTYSEPCKNRADWLKEHADHLRFRFDINPRPRFRADNGSDTATVTWFVWLKTWSWRELGLRSPFGYVTNWR